MPSASTRRALLKGGALLAAPLAGAAPAVAIAEDGRQARLSQLEDEAAIRRLHNTWLQTISRGGGAEAASLFEGRGRSSLDYAIRGVAADPSGALDEISLGSDGRTATGRFHCTVRTQARIAGDSTVPQMARLQGGGHTETTERRLLTARYVKRDDGWAIEQVAFAQA